MEKSFAPEGAHDISMPPATRERAMSLPRNPGKRSTLVFGAWGWATPVRYTWLHGTADR